MTRPETEFHLPRDRRRLLFIPGLVLIGGLLAGAATPSRLGYAGPAQPQNQTQPTEASLGWNSVAPEWTVPCGPNTYGMVAQNGGCFIAGGFDIDPKYKSQQGSQRMYEGWGMDDTTAMAGFTNLQFEIWRAVPQPEWSEYRDFSVPATELGAYQIVPAAQVGGGVEFRADVSHSRNGNWIVFLTGVGSDGIRYRLAYPESEQTTFSGTVWDWLTASD